MYCYACNIYVFMSMAICCAYVLSSVYALYYVMLLLYTSHCSMSYNMQCASPLW
jgi:hypothetical protein